MSESSEFCDWNFRKLELDDIFKSIWSFLIYYLGTMKAEPRKAQPTSEEMLRWWNLCVVPRIWDTKWDYKSYSTLQCTLWDREPASLFSFMTRVQLSGPLVLPEGVSEAGSEVSQVLEPLSSDYSICVKCFLYLSGAVFTSPHFSVAFIFSLLPNMPLWGGIFIKST